MNQETIPDNNLPFYIQQYDVNIFDDKEESFGKVLYTTVGVIPSTEKTKYGWSLNLTGYLKPNVDTYNIVYDFSKSDYENQKKIIFGSFSAFLTTIQLLKKKHNNSLPHASSVPSPFAFLLVI